MWSETNLRRQFHFQLPRQILPLELCVLADVRGDHPLDLLGLKQQTQAEVVHAEGKQAHTQTQTVKQKSSEDVRCYKSSPLFRFLAAFEQITQTVREPNKRETRTSKIDSMSNGTRRTHTVTLEAEKKYNTNTNAPLHFTLDTDISNSKALHYT